MRQRIFDILWRLAALAVVVALGLMVAGTYGAPVGYREAMTAVVAGFGLLILALMFI